MTKKTTIILISTSSVFFILGLLGLIISGRCEIIEENRLIRLSLKYFLIPSLFFGSILSYLLCFEYRKRIEKWRKILAFLPSLFAITLIYLFCFHGILRFINNTLGHQENVALNSKIVSLEKEKEKTIADITIINKTDTLVLTISEDLYLKYLNQNKFEEALNKGSLGFLYKK